MTCIILKCVGNTLDKRTRLKMTWIFSQLNSNYLLIATIPLSTTLHHNDFNEFYDRLKTYPKTVHSKANIPYRKPVTDNYFILREITTECGSEHPLRADSYVSVNAVFISRIRLVTCQFFVDPLKGNILHIQ